MSPGGSALLAAMLIPCILCGCADSNGGQRKAGIPAAQSLSASASGDVKGGELSSPIPLQSGYGGSERFCGALGYVDYLPGDGEVHIRIDLKGKLRPSEEYNMAWKNDSTRGYTVAAFQSSAVGSIDSGTLKFFRPGEVRGVGLQIYYLAHDIPTDIMEFRPC